MKEKFSIHNSDIKRSFDKNFAGNKDFNVGDLVLKWDKTHENKGKHTKFQSLWIWLYVVHDKLGHHSYCF